MADTRNFALPETNAVYYRADLPLIRPSKSYIRIRGQFPDDRYSSFSIYKGPLLTPVKTLSDYEIVPDPGSQSNIASRTGLDSSVSAGGYFEMQIRFEDLPATPAHNTIYLGPSTDSYTLAFRTYLPNANTILPTLDTVSPTEEIPFGDPRTSSGCAFETSVLIDDSSQIFNLASSVGDTSLLSIGSQPDQVFSIYYGHDFLAQNQDVRYLSTSVLNTAKYVLVRARAPTSPGYRPSPSPDLRYWSICTYRAQLESSIECAPDRNARIDASGISFFLLRNDQSLTPASGTSAIFTSISLGNDPQTLIVYRQLLDNPGFAGSANRVPQGVAPVSVIGDYVPVARTCDPLVFNAVVESGATAQQVFDTCGAH